MKTVWNKLTDTISIAVFLVFTLVYSFYTKLPQDVSYQVLRLPYILLIVFSLWVLYKILRGQYKLNGLPRALFIAVMLLGAIYLTVTVVRWHRSGFDQAKQSLYMAMATLLGCMYFFVVNCGITGKGRHRDVLVIMTALNAAQAIMSLSLPNGMRSSYLLENVMVYDCVAVAFVPQLYVLMLESKKVLPKLLAFVNILVSLLLVTLSGSRSGAAIIWGVFLLCNFVMLFKKRGFWLICIVMLLVAVVGVVGLYVKNVYNCQEAVGRLLGGKFVFTQQETEPTGEALQEETSFWDALKDREFIANNSSTDYSDSLRKTLWKMSVEEIRKSPLIGTGVAWFLYDCDDFILYQGSHNFLLEAWLVFGGVGFAVYLAMLVIAQILLFYRGHKTKQRGIAFMHSLSLWGILALALVQPLMSMVTVTVLFWMITGWGSGMQIEAAQMKEADS